MNKQAEEFDKYASQPELWQNSRMITADVPLNADRVRKILPLGLRLTDRPMGTLFIVDYVQPNFTAPYREAALLVHVKTLFGKGLHCAWMTVDDDTAMIYGRELLGFPKKMADITFDEQLPSVSASVMRRGTTVLRMTAEQRGIQERPEPVFDRKIFNAGGLGSLMALQLIWLSRSKERIRESYDAEVEVFLEPSVCDPLAKLVVPNSVNNGRFVVFDIVRGKYLLPVGLAGPRWVSRTQMLRMR